MTQENFKILLDLHEEIDELKTKLIDLERATKYKPEFYIPRGNGTAIYIVHISKEKYLSIIVDEMHACKEKIEELTKKFEAL